MRKYLAVLVLIVSIFIVNKTETKSQPPTIGCPSGVTNSIATTFTVKGCVFNVTICWKCKVTSSPLVFGISSIQPQGSCSPPISTEEALDSIYNQLTNYAWLYLFCASDIPPCSTGVYEFSVRRYNCYKMYQPSGSPLPPIINIVCDFNTYCQKDYEACLIGFGNMQLNVINDWHQVGVPTCDEMPPPLPGPGEDSDCWRMTPNCDFD